MPAELLQLFKSQEYGKTDSICHAQIESHTPGYRPRSDQGEGHELPLQLVPASELPKLLRAEVYISGPPPGAPKFLKLVQAQNKGLHTDRSVLRHQQTTNRGQLMIWGIDEQSRSALEAVDFQPHFRLGCVTFRVVRPQSGSGTGPT